MIERLAEELAWVTKVCCLHSNRISRNYLLSFICFKVRWVFFIIFKKKKKKVFVNSTSDRVWRRMSRLIHLLGFEPLKLLFVGFSGPEISSTPVCGRSCMLRTARLIWDEDNYSLDVWLRLCFESQTDFRFVKLKLLFRRPGNETQMELGVGRFRLSSHTCD